MKNSFTLLTGFMFVITFLIAGSCNPPSLNGHPEGDVTIKISTFKQSGEIHIKMKDSNGQEAVDAAIEHFITKVDSGKTVTWKVKKILGINFTAIEEIGDIIPIDTSVVFKGKLEKKSKTKFILYVPDDAVGLEQGYKEKYIIALILKHDNGTKEFDPYLQPPPP